MSETPKDKVCKDCLSEGVSTRRPTPHPGPRCATHWRAVKKDRKNTAHGNYLVRNYNMSREKYDEMIEAQGGKCALCQRATGEAKNLAVDHDHSCCPKPPTCGECNRGGLCSPCNDMLGHARDDVEFFARVILYLQEPPFSRLPRG